MPPSAACAADELRPPVRNDGNRRLVAADRGGVEIDVGESDQMHEDENERE
jgi:hypothetical protein